MNRSNIEVNRVVYLDVSEAEVVKRLTARGRADDTPAIIQNRLKVYQQETGPVVDYYKGRKEFLNIGGEGKTPEEVSNKIIKELTDD
jgi:adenylate kinase